MRTYSITFCDGFTTEIPASNPDQAIVKASEEAFSRVTEWPMRPNEKMEAIRVQKLELVEI